VARTKASDAGREAPRGRYAAADLADRREAVVAAATSLFVSRGFDRTSFEAIAREASVSPKTIYTWFGGKVGLFAAVMERMGRDNFDGLAEALDPDVAVEAALAAFGRRVLDIVTTPDVVGLQRAVIAEGQNLPDIAATFYAAAPLRAIKMLAAYLESRSIPQPLRMAETFLCLVNGELARRTMLCIAPPPTAAEKAANVAFAVQLVLAHATSIRVD
jgi:AcrR family transcriptional regulator